jgi:HlyD family secretion protein
VRLVEPAGFTKTSALGVEEQRVWVVIDIASPRADWAGLGDAFRVNVRITTQELPDVTLAPSAALFRWGEGWAAFVVEDGKARERPVQVVRRNAQEAAVGAGLSSGHTVVVFPLASLTDGGAVAQR